MLHRFKLMLLAVVALCAVCAPTANGATIEFSPGGSITAVSLGQITFSSSTLLVRCNFTLPGTLATSATASAGTQFGAITRAEFGPCEGAMRSVNNLPAELLYSRLVAEGLEFSINRWNITHSGYIFGIIVSCTYEGSLPALLTITASRTGSITLLRNQLTKVAEGSSPPCASTGTLSGTFALTQQTVTLA
jgi:hypothetical protein